MRRIEKPWTALGLACAAAGSISFATVLEPSWPLRAWENFGIHAAAMGMATALALYFWALPDGAPIRPRTAISRTLAGGVFGYLAAKAGLGFGLSEPLTTVSAGVGGAKGPTYLDKIADSLTRPKA